MNDTLVLPAFFVFGIFLGWWFKKLMPWRVLIIAAVLLIAVPIGLIFLAGLVQSDTLGWIGGLSMIFVFALGLPLILGFLLGAVLAGPSLKADVPKIQKPDKKPLLALSPDQLGGLILVAIVGVGFGVVIMVGFTVHDSSGQLVLSKDRILTSAGIVSVGLVIIGFLWPKFIVVQRKSRELYDKASGWHSR